MAERLDLERASGPRQLRSRRGPSRKPEDAAVCHGQQWVRIGRVVDRGGERQYGAEVHGPVGWTESNRHVTQDEATAAAARWRPSR